MTKYGGSNRSATGGKSLTLKDKLDAIKVYDCNERMVDIANTTGIFMLTLRSIKKQTHKIK
jgi:hypothetical protein